jgi:hypothetical protein
MFRHVHTYGVCAKVKGCLKSLSGLNGGGNLFVGHGKTSVSQHGETSQSSAICLHMIDGFYSTVFN